MRVNRTVALTGLLITASPAALAAEGASGGVFDINPGLSLWASAVFLALLAILGKFAWGPILSAVEAREDNIQSALDEARERNERAEELLREHKAQLADARRQASEIVAEGKAAGDEVRREIEEKARTEAQAIIERARMEIERQRDEALDSIRRESVELALAAASRLLHETLDDAKDRQLVERFLDEVAEDAPGAQA